MPTEFAVPEFSLRMLENAIAAMTWTFLVIAAAGAAIACIHIIWECAGTTRERPQPRVRKRETTQEADAGFLTRLCLPVENFVNK